MNGSTPDPHLGKALAHAPDHDAVPPAHLSAQILAAAHREAAKALPPLPRSPVVWWRKPWGASGALATVFLAGFIGLLWQGERPGPAVDGPAPAVTAAKTQEPAAAPVIAAEPAGSGPERQRRADAALTAQAAKQAAEAPAKAARSKAMERAADARAARDAPPIGRIGRLATADATGTSPPSPASPAMVAKPAPPPQVSPAPSPAQSPAPVAAAPPTPAPTPMAVSPAPAPAPARVADATPAPVPVPSTAPAPRPAPATAPARAAVAAAATAPAQRATTAEAMLARPAPVRLPPLRAGDQLTWQPRSGAAVPDAAWLQQLDTLTRGRWLPAEGPPSTAGAAATTAAPEALLSWQRDGAPLGVLQLKSGEVWWCAAGQACLRALVPTGALGDLIGKLPSER